MLWKKPSGMKYTDMCIYIDKNVPIIANPGQDPQVEDTVYNYLWLLVKALAIKRGLFNSFQDYDPYSFYSAERLFFALRKNYLNQGKMIKGKLIRPIKSCLNYTKSLLYPMKIEYQRLSYKQIIAEEWVTKQFDAFQYKEQLKTDAKQGSNISEKFWYYAKDTIKHSGMFLDQVLATSPFAKGSLDYKHLKMTLQLNCWLGLKNKKKLDLNPTVIIMWKLPKSMSSYVKLLLKKFYVLLKREIMDCYNAVEIDDNILERMISVNGETYEANDNY